ncbi:MAG: TIGR00282 family metallophosphoesterase [Candidatus Krumholzibacteria bacterium]|nr:TIGR00282 family metallophosphoesterase [Candidatus Krumholzibacteria bacterium]
MRILFLGDIISKSGRRALAEGLGVLKTRHAVDLCVGNVENAAAIFGITQKVIDEIVACGVDIMTSGNHVWDKREGLSLLDSREDLLRPANYPPGVPGRGFVVRETRGTPFAVINLQGRTFMTPIDCPFRSADAILSEIPPGVKIVLVDFHAEATSEKQALAAYLDGRVSAVVGTHTHVQTADERILPGGTGFITDVGMVGPIDSVIGVRKEQVIERFMRALPVRFEVSDGAACIGGLLVDVDEATGHAREVVRIREVVEIIEEQS